MLDAGVVVRGLLRRLFVRFALPVPAPMQPCAQDSVVQHWAYHGPDSKDGGAGAIMFGDDSNNLGIIF